MPSASPKSFLTTYFLPPQLHDSPASLLHSGAFYELLLLGNLVLSGKPVSLNVVIENLGYTSKIGTFLKQQLSMSFQKPLVAEN